MKCPRCAGLMRLEIIYAEGEWVWCWLCYHCGECIDPEILQNRIESLERIRSVRPKIKPVIEAESAC